MSEELLLVLRISYESILYMLQRGDLCGQAGGGVELIDRLQMRSGHMSCGCGRGLRWDEDLMRRACNCRRIRQVQDIGWWNL